MTDAVQKPALIIRQYNDLTPYEERFLEMKSLTENRDEHTPDELWILQHHDVDGSWWSSDLAWSRAACRLFYV